MIHSAASLVHQMSAASAFQMNTTQTSNPWEFQ